MTRFCSGFSSQHRDSLFGRPQGVGRETVVDQRRRVAVAFREFWPGHGVPDHGDFEALFEEIAQVY